MTSDSQSESGGVVSSTALLGDFTLDERRNFVMRHTQQLAAWQQPHLRNDYRRYVETAPEDWINKSFLQFAEMYENNKDAIRARSAPVPNTVDQGSAGSSRPKTERTNDG